LAFRLENALFHRAALSIVSLQLTPPSWWGCRKGFPLAAFGYGFVPDRAFIAFQPELEQGAWKQVSTKKYEEGAKKEPAALLQAPILVVCKLRLARSIDNLLASFGLASLVKLDQAWDATQRRLFHRIGAAVDDEDPAVREAGDRLRDGLLSGSGTAQTQLDYDSEVDFGRRQIALTQDGGPLAADAKAIKLGDTLADVEKTTEALAKGLGRAEGGKRRSPSQQQRDAMAECAAAFNSVHDDLLWLVGTLPAGPDREHLSALIKPLEALLARNQPPAPSGAASPANQPPSPPAPPQAQ
jgi:hypothetical protein